MIPSKERADEMLELLRKHAFRLPAEAYDPLFRFIDDCRKRLPRRATVERYEDNGARRKHLKELGL